MFLPDYMKYTYQFMLNQMNKKLYRPLGYEA